VTDRHRQAGTTLWQEFRSRERTSGRPGLAVGYGFAGGDAGDVGRAEFEVQHGQGASADFGKDLGQKDLSKIVDSDDVALDGDTGQFLFGCDGVDQRARSHLTFRIYFAEFGVGSKGSRQFGESLGLDEQIVLQLDLEFLAIDAETLEAAVVSGDVAFGIAIQVDRAKTTDDAVEGEATENIQAREGGRRMRDELDDFLTVPVHLAATVWLPGLPALAGDVRVRVTNVNKVLEVKIGGLGRSMAADGGQRRGGLGGNDRPQRMAKIAAQSLRVGVKMERNSG
jgi:hypothetical protein